MDDSSPRDIVSATDSSAADTNVEASLSGKDRRKTERLFSYWKNLRGERPFPSHSEIDSDFIRGLWPYCFVLPADGVAKLAFVYLGCRLGQGQGVAAPDAEAGAMEVAAVFDTARVLSHVVIEKGETARDSGAFDNRWGDEIKYRTILLPLGEQPPTVDHVLGLVSYLELQRAEIPGLKISTHLDR